MLTSDFLREAGSFQVGCNYWASHAGTAMWRNWRADVVAEDLRQLSAAGLEVLRVFPLWPDFQPLTLLRTLGGQPMEMRLDEQVLSDDEVGHAGVCPQAMGHFEELVRLAEQHGLKLIVGLLTGWMSGRLFVPPAIEGLNVLTDAQAILWELRLVRYFVRRFRAAAAVVAWDLGNECSVMGSATVDQAAVWTATISSAIRAEESSRPIISGMHGLTPLPRGPWRIQDQAEWTDVLTTHPYPIFTPHCDRDPINTMRSCLHATAESRLYADVGQKPCLVEEIGTLGPMICSEQVAADYIRTALLSSWRHDCRGLLWWCAYDQSHLSHAPYDWHSVEREMGLFRSDRTAKGVAAELGRFGRFVRELPFGPLPPRLTEATCILTAGQDCWAAGFAAFILAKQAGFDLTFQYADQLIQPCLYLLPSLHGDASISQRRWRELLEQVRAGAVLYASLEDAILSPFGEPFGLQVQTRQRRSEPAEILLTSLPGEPTICVPSAFRLNSVPRGATVLACEKDGNPAFTVAQWGKGKVFLLSVPLEEHLSRAGGVFHGDDSQPYWKIYESLARSSTCRRAVRKRQPIVGLTEHPLDAGRRVVVAINYSPQPLEASLELAGGWHVGQSFYGVLPSGRPQELTCSLKANDGVVFVVERR